MHHATQDKASVPSMIETQLHLIDAYQQHLENIKQAISHNDNDELNRLIENNTVLFTPLEQGFRQILQAMPGFGFPASHDGINRFIATNANPRLDQLKAEWDDKLQHLQQSLLVNDLLIRKNQHRVRQCIRILAGHSSANADTTYNRQGDNQELSNAQRMLARA